MVLHGLENLLDWYSSNADVDQRPLRGQRLGRPLHVHRDHREHVVVHIGCRVAWEPVPIRRCRRTWFHWGGFYSGGRDRALVACVAATDADEPREFCRIRCGCAAASGSAGPPAPGMVVLPRYHGNGATGDLELSEIKRFTCPGAPCKGEVFQSRCIGKSLPMAIGIKVVATRKLLRTRLAISGKSGQVPDAVEEMKLPASCLRTVAQAANIVGIFFLHPAGLSGI